MPLQPESSNVVRTSFLERALDASVLAGPLVRLWQRSLVGQLVIRFLRSFSGRTSWIGRRIARRSATRTFPHAVHALVESRIVRPVDVALTSAPRAWHTSGSKQLLDRATGPLDVPMRIRMIGISMVTAVLIQTFFADGRLMFASLRSLIAPLIVVGVGVVLISASRSLAVAWSHWR